MTPRSVALYREPKPQRWLSSLGRGELLEEVLPKARNSTGADQAVPTAARLEVTVRHRGERTPRRGRCGRPVDRPWMAIVSRISGVGDKRLTAKGAASKSRTRGVCRRQYRTLLRLRVTKAAADTPSARIVRLGESRKRRAPTERHRPFSASICPAVVGWLYGPPSCPRLPSRRVDDGSIVHWPAADRCPCATG